MAESHPFCGETRVIIRGIDANVLNHRFETETCSSDVGRISGTVAGDFSKRRAPTEIDWLWSAEPY